MALHFLNFNEENCLIVFKPSDFLTASDPNLGGLSTRAKHCVKGVVFDERLISRYILWSNQPFFQLRHLSKAKTFHSFKDFEKVIHAYNF